MILTFNFGNCWVIMAFETFLHTLYVCVLRPQRILNRKSGHHWHLSAAFVIDVMGKTIWRVEGSRSYSFLWVSSSIDFCRYVPWYSAVFYVVFFLARPYQDFFLLPLIPWIRAWRLYTSCYVTLWSSLWVHHFKFNGRSEYRVLLAISWILNLEFHLFGI